MTIRQVIAALENFAEKHGDDVEVIVDDEGIFRAPMLIYEDENHSDGTITQDFVLL